MRTKYVLFILPALVFLTVALVLPAAAQPSKAQSGQKVIRFAYSVPSKKQYAFGWEWFGPEFEKRTKGRYKIEYYPGGTLFNVAAAFDSVQANVGQIANVSVGQLEKRLPLSNGLLLPTLDFPGTVKGRLAASKAFMEMYGKFPQLQAEWKGVKLLGYHQLYPYILASKKKEVYLPEHFKGMKVGGTGAKMKLVSNAGGADVNQVPPDAYMNLDKGVTDACFIAWNQTWDYHLSEVARYFYDFSFSGGGFGIIMNLDAWNAMSGDDQKIFIEVWTRALEMGENATYGDEEKGMKAAKDSGAIVRKPTDTEVAAWRKAAGPIIQQWIADAKKAGAKDPEVVLAEWQRLIQAHKE